MYMEKIALKSNGKFRIFLMDSSHYILYYYANKAIMKEVC